MSKSVRRPSQKISKVSKVAKTVCRWFVERSDAERVVMQLSGGQRVAAQFLFAILLMSHRSQRNICHKSVAPLLEQQESPRGSMSVKSKKATQVRARGVDDRDETFPWCPADPGYATDSACCRKPLRDVQSQLSRAGSSSSVHPLQLKAQRSVPSGSRSLDQDSSRSRAHLYMLHAMALEPAARVPCRNEQRLEGYSRLERNITTEDNDKAELTLLYW